MNREDKFWASILELRFAELLSIARDITSSAEERFEDNKNEIYIPEEFAKMLVDYADANLETEE